MVPSDLARLRSWFASYVSGFFTGADELDRVFKLKQMHTERVCITIRRLGKTLQLSSREMLLAEAAALLLPILISVSIKTGTSASSLLMPIFAPGNFLFRSNIPSI